MMAILVGLCISGSYWNDAFCQMVQKKHPEKYRHTY
ncbi:MAG: hypothetical protein DELT_02233 [Desulfovibrio sp.]